MATHSLEDITEVTLPNGRKVKVKTANLKSYQEDVNRERNRVTLPEVIVSAKKQNKTKKISLKDINWDASSPEAKAKIKKLKEAEGNWYDYGLKNIKDTFGVSARDIADFTPIVGDVLSLNDINSYLNKGDYGNAALAAGMFVLPNIIEKPLKSLVKYGRNTIRKLNRNYNTSNFEKKYYKLIDKAIDTDNRKKYSAFIEELKNNEEAYTRKSRDDIKDAVKKSIRNRLVTNYKNLAKNLTDVQLAKFDKNSKEEDILLFNPAYNYYTVVNDLDPYDPKTVDKFIQNQSYSIRGIYTKNKDEDYIKYLTEADNKHNPDRRGGDMFNSRGLYTSNSNKVADKFNKAIADPNTKGYIAKLYHDFEIDKTKSVEEQLQQLQDRIFEFSILEDLRKQEVYIKDIDKFRMNNPDIHAWESPYFGETVKQRAYVNTSDEKSKRVADIVDLTEYSQGGVRKDRFSLNNAPTKDLFMAQYPGFSRHNIQRYTDLIYNNQKLTITDYGAKLLEDYGNRLYGDQIYKTKLNDDLYKRNKLIANNISRYKENLNKINNYSMRAMLPISIIAGGALGIAGYNRKYRTKKTINELNNLNDAELNSLYGYVSRNPNSVTENYYNIVKKVKTDRDKQKRQKRNRKSLGGDY